MEPLATVSFDQDLRIRMPSGPSRTNKIFEDTILARHVLHFKRIAGNLVAITKSINVF